MIDEKKLIEQLRESNYHHASNSREEVLLDRTIRIVLEQPKVGEWIPVDERLPKEKKVYEEIIRSPLCLVTVLSDDELMIGIDRTVNGVWTLEETFDKPKIIAWQPLQEPYSSGTRKNSKKSSPTFAVRSFLSVTTECF